MKSLTVCIVLCQNTKNGTIYGKQDGNDKKEQRKMKSAVSGKSQLQESSGNNFDIGFHNLLDEINRG
ncbi:hypothetical protein [Extibacter muris]|uniref:hypothetical protein n=1 Tax=Extibacter muris TaxID=1796622 RepID=UPI0021C57B30|nr:hypothetical protein [Extibacter muris]MCU0077867.1 hypothetical protein [Extibacter muris]